MYVTFMAIGVFTLAIVYPVLMFNERKRLNLTIAWDTVNDYLFIAEKGRTSKENSNRLIFA